MTTQYIVADDSLFARMLVKDAVKQIDEAAAFTEAKSGAEVLAKREEGFAADWYLLDINMEAPNGVDTARQLVESGVPNTKIALITGNKSADLQQQAAELGVCYINKAISPTDVEEFVLRLDNFFKGGES